MDQPSSETFQTPSKARGTRTPARGRKPASKTASKPAGKTIRKTTSNPASKPAAKAIAAKTVAKTNESVAAQPNDPSSFRVFRWDSSLREGLRLKREQHGVTQRQLIRNLVEAQLPSLVEKLAELGVSVEDRASEGPVRVPLDASTLASLRSASNWTDLPQNLLLQACLRLGTRK